MADGQHTLFILEESANDENSSVAKAMAARAAATNPSIAVETVELTCENCLREPLPSSLRGVPTLVLPGGQTLTGTSATSYLRSKCVENLENAGTVRRAAQTSHGAPVIEAVREER